MTLQPIRRYGFDAAILFADILVVPDALGQKVDSSRAKDRGSSPSARERDLARLNAGATRSKFGRVFETVARVRQELRHDTALIGFCGAPWTVATYMVGGQGSTDQAEARLWAYRDPDGFQRLIDLLVEVSVDYLSGQVAAGADVLQIFDSWAGAWPTTSSSAGWWRRRRTWSHGSRRSIRDVPIIGFPRGAGVQAPGYVAKTGVDGVGCDTACRWGSWRASLRAGRWCRAISIRCCWSRAARRWSGALPKF